MNFRSHSLRSERPREDAYFAEVDRVLLATLRAATELQREAERCAQTDQQEQNVESQFTSETGGTITLSY